MVEDMFWVLILIWVIERRLYVVNLIVPQRNTKFLVIFGKFLSIEQLWRIFNNYAQ